MNESSPPFSLLENSKHPRQARHRPPARFRSAGLQVLQRINPRSPNLYSNQLECMCGRGGCFKPRFTGRSGESIKTFLGGLLKLKRSHRRPKHITLALTESGEKIGVPQ